MYKALLILFVLVSLAPKMLMAQAIVDATVENDVENFVVTLYTNSKANAFDIFEEYGAANTSSNPHKVYIPFINPSASSVNTNFSYFSNRSNLPKINVAGNDSVNTQIRFTLDVDVNGNQDDLHVAVSDTQGGTYYVLDFIGTYTDGVYNVDVSLQDICSQVDITFDCSDFDEDNAPSALDSVVLFFFVNDGALVDGDEVTVGNFTGEYYEVQFSNRIYTDQTVNMGELFKGDEQLRASYSTFSFSSGTTLGLFSYAEAGAANTLCDAVVDSNNTNRTLGGLGLNRGNLFDLETTVTSGNAAVKNLENNRCYTIRLFWCDRFGFCSYSSQAIQNTPEDIESLLEKQACFFFTAGFGEEHPVVNYFQAWRDQFLKKYALGRAFIKWYYEFAPQHTPYILERPWLQKTIRAVGYGLYGALRYFWVFIFLLGLAVVHFFGKRSTQHREKPIR